MSEEKMMSCLQPYLRIKLGYKRWYKKDRVLDDKSVVTDVIDTMETGELKEKARLVFDFPSNRKKLDESNTPYDVIPCGVCEECYKRKVKDWAIRILNETSYHIENYFITLTYDDKHLPKNNSVDKKSIQKYFKRLKDFFYNFKDDSGIRVYKDVKFKYYCVAEYGEGKGQRNFVNPHYHFIAFGLPLLSLGLTDVFPDGRKHWSGSGEPLYYCSKMMDLWCDEETRENLGFVTIQSVDFGSACYVAGYVHKKMRESKPIIHQEIDFIKAPDGRALALVVPKRYNPYEYLGIEKPFSLMSKGIGARYLQDNIDKIFKTDEIFYKAGNFGVMSSLPNRYYLKKLEQHNPDKAKEIKDKRKVLASTTAIDNDKDYFYNKSVLIDINNAKKERRKRGLTSLS